MPVWKLDLVFEANGRGWEETYYRNFSGSDFGSAFTVANTLAQKRIGLSAAPVVIKAYRVTDPLTIGRQGQVFYFNPVISAAQRPDDVGAADPATSINIGFIQNAQNLTRRIQLRGVWDDAIRNFGQLDGGPYAAWFQVFGVYRTYLLQQGFGWLNRARAFQNQPVSYSIAVNPVIPVFTFPAAALVGIPDDSFFMARFSRFNGSSSLLNRELILLKASATTASAAAPIAAGPMITPGRAIIYATPALVTADNVGVERVGRRAPGRPLLLTPGHARPAKRT